MIIGILKIDLYIPGASSLKEKRMVLKGLKDRVRRTFNVSIAELEYQDKWQRALLGIAAIGQDRQFVNSVLDKALDFMETFRGAEISNHELEII